MRIEDAKIKIPEKSNSSARVNQRVSVYSEDYKGEFYNISVDKLIPYKNQARKIFDPISLESLAETIKTHGIRQPLTIITCEDKAGFYEIISGERRYKAALIAKLKSVPCIIIHDKKQAEEIAIIENIQREDLHPVELKNAYESLLNNKICNSMQEIADKLRINKSSVVETMNLRNLSSDAQNAILNNKISNRDFLRLICKTNNKDQLIQIDNYLKTKNVITKKLGGKKSKIIVLSLENDQILVEKNNINRLKDNQKDELLEILNDIMGGRDRDPK